MRKTLATLLAFAMAATAQTPAAPQQPAQDAGLVKFTTTSRLILEAVSVVDKNGKPVEGLRKEDFTVTENGAPQTISIFEYQKLSDEPAPPLPAAAPLALEAKPAAPLGVPTAAPAVQIAAETPGKLKYQDRRLMVLYFDLSHMQAAEQLRALTSAAKFVDTKMTASDVVSIMEYSNGSVKVRQDFTGDRNALKASIEKILITAQGLDDDAVVESGGSFGQDDGEFNIFNTDRQVAALQTAVNMLARVQEKKVFVLFASGLAMNGVDNQAQLRATLNAAIRANVAFWPIDARGLTASAPMGGAMMANAGGMGAYTGATAMGQMAAMGRSQDTLYALAADTGGKAMVDFNDLELGIERAQKAVSSYYILGYYTTNFNLDGKFRRINIAIKEFPNHKLDYRQGYFGDKEFTKFSAAEKERQLEDAFMLEDPVTELTIAMELNYFQLNNAEYYIPVVMKIPGSELALAKKGGAERTRIDFLGEIKDEYNVTHGNIRDHVDAELTNATAAELSKRQILYVTGHTMLPGVYTIKVLARDAETGRIGTYISKFTVPNLRKDTQRVRISTVVLSSQRVALKDALFTANKDKEQVANPLVQDGQELIPSVTRVFSRQREMFVYLQAYEPDVEKFQPLLAYVTFYRNQVKAFETAPLPVLESMPTRLKTTPMKFSVDLAKLPTGRYDCQVTVVNPEDNKVAFWQAPIVIAP